jgi:signal transduction histidine kinase
MPPLDSWMVVTVRVPFVAVIPVVIALIGLIGFVVITFRRNLRQIRILTHSVEELNREIAQSETSSIRSAYLQFTYHISHEVSNPLQSVQINLENMADCSPGEIGRWKQYYAIIKQEIKRLFALTENLRLLSQLERGSVPIEREPVNLQSVIENIIMAQTERASTKNISLKYEGPIRPGKVFGNRAYLHQLIINLVDNSIKYSKESIGEIVIQLSEGDNFLRITVRDDGIGIPEEDLPFVFDTAYRSINRGNRTGSGLGLAIVRRIVEEHEGTVRADSTVGEGTTVTVDLPIYNPS